MYEANCIFAAAVGFWLLVLSQITYCLHSDSFCLFDHDEADVRLLCLVV